MVWIGQVRPVEACSGRAVLAASGLFCSGAKCRGGLGWVWFVGVWKGLVRCGGQEKFRRAKDRYGDPV